MKKKSNIYNVQVLKTIQSAQMQWRSAYENQELISIEIKKFFYHKTKESFLTNNIRLVKRIFRFSYSNLFYFLAACWNDSQFCAGILMKEFDPTSFSSWDTAIFQFFENFCWT